MSVHPGTFAIHKSYWSWQEDWEEGEIELTGGLSKKWKEDNGRGRSQSCLIQEHATKWWGKEKEKGEWKGRENSELRENLRGNWSAWMLSERQMRWELRMEGISARNWGLQNERNRKVWARYLCLEWIASIKPPNLTCYTWKKKMLNALLLKKFDVPVNTEPVIQNLCCIYKHNTRRV